MRESAWGFFTPTVCMSRLFPLALCSLLAACATLPGMQAPWPEASRRAVRAMTAQEQICYLGREAGGRSDQPVLVMLLSPRMVYTLQEWPRMKQVAEARGYRVLSWMDPRVPELEWQAARSVRFQDAALSIQAMPVACRPIWDHVNHSPMSLVLAGTRIHPWPVWGVMPDDPWREALQFRWQALREKPMTVPTP